MLLLGTSNVASCLCLTDEPSQKGVRCSGRMKNLDGIAVTIVSLTRRYRSADLSWLRFYFSSVRLR